MTWSDTPKKVFSLQGPYDKLMINDDLNERVLSELQNSSDQVGRSVNPDLDLNCLLRLSADDISHY